MSNSLFLSINTHLEREKPERLVTAYWDASYYFSLSSYKCVQSKSLVWCRDVVTGNGAFLLRVHAVLCLPQIESEQVLPALSWISRWTGVMGLCLAVQANKCSLDNRWTRWFLIWCTLWLIQSVSHNVKQFPPLIPVQQIVARENKLDHQLQNLGRIVSMLSNIAGIFFNFHRDVFLTHCPCLHETLCSCYCAFI